MEDQAESSILKGPARPGRVWESIVFGKHAITELTI